MNRAMEDRATPVTDPLRAPGSRPIHDGKFSWGREVLLIVGVLVLLTGLDQWTKAWAVERLGPISRDAAGRFRPPPDHPPLEVWEGYLRFSLTGNSGAIFGMGRSIPDSVKRPLFVSLSLLAMVFVIVLIRSSQPDQRLRRIGLGAVLSGALGNLADRLWLDYVVDFIDWYGGVHWPTFNVADIAITVGVLLTLVDLWWHPDPLPEAAAAPDEGGDLEARPQEERKDNEQA